MADSESGQGPEFTFCDDDGRARITSYVHTSTFRVGDMVYLRSADGRSREGPFVVASVPSPGRYTLCLENGRAVKNGDEIEERYLEAA